VVTSGGHLNFRVSSSGALRAAVGPENVMLGRRLTGRRQAVLDRAA